MQSGMLDESGESGERLGGVQTFVFVNDCHKVSETLAKHVSDVALTPDVPACKRTTPGQGIEPWATIDRELVAQRAVYV